MRLIADASQQYTWKRIIPWLLQLTEKGSLEIAWRLEIALHRK